MRSERASFTASAVATDSLARRLSSKRVGLALSSGFFGFYHHAGVLRALVEAGVVPVAVTGVSAGAIVGAMYAAGLEPDEIARELLRVRRKDFWDVGWPFTRNGFGVLSGNAFAEVLARVLPVHGFEQCRILLSVSAYELSTGRVCYLSQGAIVTAVRASCAVPYLFAPVEVEGRVYWDGGFAEKTAYVPFLFGEPVDAVVVSGLPMREERRRREGFGLSRVARWSSSLFAQTPSDERREREERGRALVEEAGMPVFVLSPEPVELGPFALDRAREAIRVGHESAARILAEPVDVRS